MLTRSTNRRDFFSLDELWKVLLPIIADAPVTSVSSDFWLSEERTVRVVRVWKTVAYLTYILLIKHKLANSSSRQVCLDILSYYDKLLCNVGFS